MANDVNANIRVNLDTSQALAGLQSLQSRISSFNQSVIQSNAQAVAAQRNLLNNFQAEIGSSRQFSTSIRTTATEVGRLQTAIDKNKLSTGQYFKYAAASSKNFGKAFRQENEQITRLATERVRRLQTQYIALGEAQNGMQRSLAVRPLQLFNADTAVSVQRMQIFNRLLRDGGTSIVNWGKNTQWAGRQLMVGFTVPLSIFGATASKIFMDLEEQAIAFRKVYGDIFTTTAEVEENLEAVRGLSQELTKYGIAVTDTMETANVAAQAGFRGADLMSQTQEATRLAVLGQMEQSEAMRTTITLQNAFKLSNEELADAVNYLNIVENQTVLSIQDFAGAIPRVAPVIQSLGGDVRDLSVMLVAMREGGVTAAEGANALKTSLARLISPTSGASSMAKELGINLDSIVEANQGDILGAVMQLAKAMEGLDELAQQRLLSEIFGKRQYARIGALFNNITDEASQSARALDLAGMSIEQLAETAENELGVVQEAIGTKFTGAVERLKLAIAPIGEIFLKIATPIINAAGNLVEKFNELSPTVKNFVAILAAGVGIVVPSVLMLVGLFGNLLGNLVKGFGTLNTFFNRLRYGAEATEYLSGEQLDAVAAASSLEGQTTSLTGSLNIQREAVDSLTQAYTRYVAGANAAASNLPQGFRTPSARTVVPATMATGGMVGGVGNKDTEPALLTPGEFVINADASKKFAPLLAAINEGRIGKYARGKTEGNISFGSLGSVRIAEAYDQSSINAIQRMANDLAGAGDDVRLAFMRILEDLSQTQGLTKGMVQQAEALKSSQFPEISGMAGESKYSASKAGERRSIETQLREDLAERANNEELIRQEYARAQAAADGAVRSINEYYDDLVRNANSQEEINKINEKRVRHVEEASRIDRAHIIELTNAQKLERESWNARLWMPQSGIENQFSNMLARSENNQAIYEQYLMDLADTSVSEDQRLQILEKVRGNIALTDSELDIQARVLQNIVEDAERNAILVRKANGEFAKMSAEFIPYAQGAIGAAGGRAAMGPVDPAVQAERIAMSQGVIGGFRDDIRANSPSEAAADVADSVPEGVAKGIKRSTPQATAAARELAQEVEGQLMMEFEDDDALFPAAPYKGERRLQPIRQPVATPIQSQQPYPLPVAPKSVQDDLVRATKKASTGFNNAGNQASQAAKQFSGLRGGITKFGGALKNGSIKMQGAFFALDGLVFAASMMNGSLGEVAQKALPLVFGLQGLTMVLPMLTNKFTLMAAPLIASAAAIWFFKKKADDMSKEVSKMSESLISTRKTIDKVGDFFGNQSIVAQQQALELEEQTGIKDEDLEKAKEFLQTDVGKQISEGIATGVQDFGSSTAGTQFANNLASMVLQGVMSPEQAKAVALQVGEEMQDKVFALRVNGQLNQLMGPNNQNLLEKPLELAVNISRSGQKTISQVSENVDQLGSQIQGFNESTAGDLGAAFIPIFGSINLINKATLDWDNSIGRVARSARGILNLDNYEDVERSLMSVGNVVGNQLIQSYANLDAATTRYEQSVEEASKKEGKAKKKAIKNAQEAKKAEDLLRDSIKKQEDDYRSMFSSLEGASRVTVLEGMRTSLSEQFADNPALKMAYDVLAGRLKGASQEIQFNINMALASGQLNPQAAQFLFNQIGNDKQASQILNLAVQNSGVDETNERLINIFNMSDEDLQREAMMTFKTSYTGESTAEQEEELNKLRKAAEEADLAYQEFLYSGAREVRNDAITNAERELEDLQVALAEVLETEKLRIEYSEDGEALSEEEIEKRARATEEYKNALAETEDAQKRYDSEVNKSMQENEQWQKENKRLLDERTKAQNEYNEAASKKPDSPELAAAKEEFLGLKDAIQQVDGMKIEFDTEGMSLSAIQEANRNLAMLQNFPPEVRKIVDLDVISDPDALDEALEGYLLLKSQDPQVVKTAILDVISGEGGTWRDAKKGLDAIGLSLDEFAAKDNQFKTAVMATIEAEIKVQASITNLEGMLDTGNLDPVARQGVESLLSQKNSELERLAEILQGFADVGDETGGGDNEPSGPSGSGGSKNKATPIKDFKNEIMEQLRLYTDINSLIPKLSNQKKMLKNVIDELGFNNNLIQEMRAANLSEEVIADLLSKGSKTAEKIFNSLKKRKQLKTFNAAQAMGTVGAAVLKNTKAANQARRALVVQNKLVASGLDEETAANIASNEALAESLFYIRGNAKAWDQFVDSVLQVEDATEEVDYLSEKIKELNKQREAEIKPMQEKIDAQQEVINGIQSEINVLEERNDADQNIIRGKQRQIDMIERQIDATERLNEADERRIESLNRESEIRSRVSEALSRELDQMSKAEDQIRDAYQDRIDALDKVASINDYILNQQKGQLDLSRAAAEGDVYAATAAAQAMRAASAAFSKDQVRAGLEQGMENQIAGLRTSGGLTREEAEQRIADIAEQNYQTSLKIREIEDVIYQRNLDLIPLKDQIRSINDEIVVIEDRIYDRETEILNITNQRLKPQQTILDKLNDEKEAREKIFEENVNALEIAQDIEDGVISQGENVNALADAWYGVAQQIKNARDTAAGKLADLAPPDPAKFKKNEKYEKAYAKWEKRRAEIIAKREADIAAALADGNAKLDAALQVTGAYAGGMIEEYGMGGKIKKYRAGGVISGMQSLASGGNVFGSGSRDSVPAILTPGEFVIRKAMVSKYGEGMMKDINMGSFAMPTYDTGREMETGVVAVTNNNVSNISAPVYNTYDMKFSINGANQSADEIANKVMFKMKHLQNQQIRGNRGY